MVALTSRCLREEAERRGGGGLLDQIVLITADLQRCDSIRQSECTGSMPASTEPCDKPNIVLCVFY